ncbi:acid phosphatase [Trifolium repens]|nr:acid phosphatase [Trifolium repens]
MTIPLLNLFLLFSFFALSFSHQTHNPQNHHNNHHAFPRPLILEYSELQEEVKLRCTSWRFAGEANNLSPWKTVPKECAEYVKEYIVGDKLSQRMNNKELRTLRKKTRTMNKT